jgi:hypothetical protein
VKAILTKLLWLLLWLPVLADAHQQGSSYSRWQLDENPQVTVRISELDLTRASLHPQYSDDYGSKVLAYAQAHLRLWQGNVACVPHNGEFKKAEPGWLSLSWSYACEGNADSWTIESHLLLAQAPSHLHFVRWQQAQQQTDRLLTVRDNRWLLTAETAEASGFLRYTELGVVHILEGWDHLAFVLGLLLLARSWRSLLWLVSGFTVGHSVTLVLATLGWLQPNIVLIEAVIAWSIALIATELLWLKQQRYYWLALPLFPLLWALTQSAPSMLLLGLAIFTVAYFVALKNAVHRQNQIRAAVTIAFGLIHGCGFASVLAGLALPNAELASSLLGFNIGVELGQLAVVVLAWPILKWLSQKQPVLPAVIAVLLLGLASFWWTTRLL